MISVIVPYYRNPAMLKVHLNLWRSYSDAVLERLRLIVVDDGSPEPAFDIVEEYANAGFLQLYRIKVDIPWNRNGARNLGAHVAKSSWLLHVDIDHILPKASAEKLASMALPTDRWYRFERFRVGAADETRQKDAIPPHVKFGKIKPHIDSYLCQQKLYWDVGGYDEDYSGSLGGGSPFLKQMEASAPVQILPVPLHVYTRSECEDASDIFLSRDRSRYTEIRKAKDASRSIKAMNPLRFPWERVL